MEYVNFVCSGDMLAVKKALIINPYNVKIHGIFISFFSI